MNRSSGRAPATRSQVAPTEAPSAPSGFTPGHCPGVDIVEHKNGKYKYKVKATSGRGQPRWANEGDLELVTSAADRERGERERTDRERVDRERADRERVFFLGHSGVVLVKAHAYHGPVWLPQAKPCPW